MYSSGDLDMSLSQKQINKIIKEELNRALSERGLWEMDDDGMMGGGMSDMDGDMGFDVVADEEGAETAMAAMEDEMGIDWSSFDAFDADQVGAAFIQAGKDLTEETPDETPTAEQIVARMMEILEVEETSEDMDSDEDSAEVMGEENEEEAEEGSLYESRFRKLAGLRD